MHAGEFAEWMQRFDRARALRPARARPGGKGDDRHLARCVVFKDRVLYVGGENGTLGLFDFDLPTPVWVPLELSAEARQEPYLRYRPIDEFNVDLIYGRNLTGENANWITLATVVRFKVPETGGPRP